MTIWIVAILMVLGAFFIFIASLGLVRMPDLFLRMSATSKAATLGAGLMLLATMIYFNDFAITIRVLSIIAFLTLTIPVAAHMIGRAAYFDGVPLWEKTEIDELRGHYALTTHELESEPRSPVDHDQVQKEEQDDFI
ncbi:MAG: monovalent cation/H(+) antiporter subunit G [Anaerolineales bacterium]|nr:monovalent cation/H(+) antiporter subunit G [Anaerolineales bacterium]